MDEVLEQDHSMTNDDFKGSSTRSSKPSSNASRSRQDKRRRRRTNSENSTSSSRSSSSSSTHSTQSSTVEPQDSTTSTTKKCRSALAQEHLQTVVEKTKTGHYDVIDNFAFLTFETDDDWRRAFENLQQHDRYQKKNFSTKKTSSTSTKKLEHSDGQNSTLHRSISAPCKSEDGQRIHSTPNSAPAEETIIDNHRSSIWQKNSHESSSTKTIKNESMDKSTRSSRNPSEHDDTQTNHHHEQQSPPSSSQKSNDENKSDTQEKKHHHHHHHHHKSHKKHKSRHDVTVNGDSSTKHPTITSMSDLAKQHIKSESMPMGPPFPFPSHFDPKLFPLPSYAPFPSPSTSHSNSFDPSLMLAGRLYGGQYPRDLPMPPPPPPPPVGSSTAHQQSRSLPNVDSAPSMEKILEKFYPGVIPSYLASSPVSSLNMKLPGTSSNGSEHSLWSHRDAYQRQFLANSTTKTNSTKIPPHHHHHHPSPSPTDRPHHSSNSNPPTQTPLYIAPVIVTEFHQHQHNHNHTHEHKLNITTKDDRSQSNSSASPRSKSPLSNESKKPKSSFSVNDMFIEKSPMKHSPSPHQQGFLSVMNKKDTPTTTTTNNNNNNNTSSNNSHLTLKKSFNGKWSTAHIHIARMISQLERNQREKSHSNNKLRSTPAPPPLLPPPLPLLENPNDIALLRPPLPSPFGLPLDMNMPPYPLFRQPPTPSSSSSSSSSAMKNSRPTTTTPSGMKPPTIKRELKTPFVDDRLHRPSPPPPLPSPALSRSTSNSNFPPSSPSQRLRMDFPSSLLLPPHQHHLANFSLSDDRKRFMPTNADLLGPPPFPNSSSSSPFFFPMGMGSLPGLPPSPSSRRNVHFGNSDPSKTSFFPSSSSSNTSSLNPFDFTRTPFLHGGIPLGNPSFESDRYRLILEQQAREREFQFAFMTAAANNGNGPGAPGLPPPPHPSLFPDPNASALFKHY